LGVLRWVDVKEAARKERRVYVIIAGIQIALQQTEDVGRSRVVRPERRREHDGRYAGMRVMF
jgi:hypothetical protein